MQVAAAVDALKNAASVAGKEVDRVKVGGDVRDIKPGTPGHDLDGTGGHINLATLEEGGCAGSSKPAVAQCADPGDGQSLTLLDTMAVDGWFKAGATGRGKAWRHSRQK